VLPGRNGARVCASLTLASGAEVNGVPEAILQVREIAKDVSSGGLRVKRKPSAVSNQPLAGQVQTGKLRKKRKQPKKLTAES
jgi:hypothetical protein